MKAIDRKMIRDLWHLRGQVIATAVVVACGVASFVTMRSTYESLVESRDTYYSQYRFAQVFGSLKRAPNTVARQIAEIPGAAQVQTRVSAVVTLDLPEIAEPAQGRLISIDPGAPDRLNDLFLLRGRGLEKNADEVLISGAFADANGLNPGDTLKAVMNGKLRRLQIVGVVLSPEYVYEIRPGDIFPDNRRFGVLWMDRRSVAAAFDMQEAFNDLAITLAPGAGEQGVIEAVDRILAQYGGLGAYGRADQNSHRFVENELGELRVFGTFLPAIFLGVTAFLLHLILSRLVNVEREQIGALKAFGYSNRDVGVHYLKLSVVAIVGGVILGIVLGALLGSAMNALYGEYFHFPIVEYGVSFRVVLWSFAISIGAAAIGSASAVRRAAALPPAEAMRPEAPANFHAGILESSGLRGRLSTEWRIVARNLVRHPIKALLSAFGISLSIALLFVGFYFFDAIFRILSVQFDHVQREDVEVTFIEPKPGRVQADLGRMAGVGLVEPYRIVPAILRSSSHTRRIAVMGVNNDGELRRVVDADLNRIIIPPEGIVLGRTIADSLGVDEGDTITVEVTEGGRPVRQIVVTRVIDELLGLGTYMELSALNRFMHEGDTLSGAYLKVDSDRRQQLYSSLKQMPGIAGVSLPDAVESSFNETMGRTIGTMSFVLVGFACVIAFGVVYNGARIALAERGRELASLRVLGFTRREIGKMLLGEQTVLTLAAIPLGWCLGLLTAWAVTRMVDAEIVRLPLVFSTRTFAASALIVAAAALISGFLVTWRIRRMDLIAVLKTRE